MLLVLFLFFLPLEMNIVRGTLRENGELKFSFQEYQAFSQCVISSSFRDF